MTKGRRAAAPIRRSRSPTAAEAQGDVDNDGESGGPPRDRGSGSGGGGLPPNGDVDLVMSAATGAVSSSTSTSTSTIGVPHRWHECMVFIVGTVYTCIILLLIKGGSIKHLVDVLAPTSMSIIQVLGSQVFLMSQLL